VSNGAIGAAVGGLAVIAALALLLLWFKKKRLVTEVSYEEDEEEVVPTNSLTEHENYISEYGLSDRALQEPSGGDLSEVPQTIGENGKYVSDEGNASEHNPEDGDDFVVHEDET
jgi:hypothetical protein